MDLCTSKGRLNSEDPYACIDNTVLSCETNAEAEVRAFKESGGALIVDTTPIGCGRNPKYVERTMADDTVSTENTAKIASLPLAVLPSPL